MRAISALIALGLALWGQADAQEACPAGRRTQNVIIVLIDGVRWEEVFRGADARFFEPEQDGLFRQADRARILRGQFLGGAPHENRAALMPFLWGRMAEDGQIYGNRDRGSAVRVGNPVQFSYPSHSEILTGIVEPRITGNIALPNPNTTVLEALGRLEALSGRTAAFSSWHHYPFIINAASEDVFVHSPASNHPLGAGGAVSDVLRDFVDLQPRGLHSDILTFHAWKQHAQARRPRVSHLVFSVTDRAAHAGHYDDYLVALQQADLLIGRIWAWAQAQLDYAGTTTLIVTTDHGRGSADPQAWRYHGQPGYYGFSDGQDPTMGDEWAWLAIMGPDTPALGEVSGGPPLTIGQVAPTAAALLGFDLGTLVQDSRVAEPVTEAFGPCPVR